MRKHRWKPRTNRFLSFILALAVGLIAGCGTTSDNGVKTQSYGDDGYLGMTNSHTKIPGRHMALNYKNDAAMMRESIRNLPGVAGSNVTFNGADAYVTVKLKSNLMDREIPSVERQAATVLRFNFPRYNIHVQSLPAGK